MTTESMFESRTTGTGPVVVVRVRSEVGPGGDLRFTDTFSVGRSKECDLVIKEASISRKHLNVEFDGRQWWVHDLGSGNGSFLNGQRIDRSLLPDSATIELGENGPQLSLVVERKPEEKVVLTKKHFTFTEPLALSPPLPDPKHEFTSETQIIKRYFAKGDAENAGEQTMMFHRAFVRAHKKKSKKYWYLIGVAAMLLVVAVGVIMHQKSKLEKMRDTAQNIFYLMKTQELQIARLEELILLSTDPGQVAELKVKKEKFRGLEKEYDNFVKELSIYAKLSEEDRVIMRTARLFGECEVNMPAGFVDEVKRYIGIWKSTDRLQTALNRARQKGYTPLITRILSDNNLQTQYFFLALQESNFNEQAVGPKTRYGHAKGMWQFIAQTADRYGLRIGPLYDQPVYDPQDERFNFVKSTVAAMKYIRELNTTYAQASGLLVMASYNWGEGNVREIISKMPENPRERNFWRLLAMKNIPKETYDYVFSIFSAAVICEAPSLFGCDCTCPREPSTGQPATVEPQKGFLK